LFLRVAAAALVIRRRHAHIGLAMIAVILLTSMVSGCISIISPSQTSAGAPSVVVATDVSNVDDVTWLTPDQLVAQRSPYSVQTSFGEARLWTIRPDGSGLAEIETEAANPECTRLDLLGPDRLPDGRLGYLRSCLRGTNTPLNTLEAFDIANGSVQTLVQTDRLLSHPTWAPDMQHGYARVGGGICDGIVSLTRQGTGPAPIVVAAEPRPFRIDETFDSSAAQDCTQTVRSVSPALSPDGKTLAFFGSPASIGVKDLARTDVPFDLFLVNLDSMVSTSLLADLTHPSGLHWSPDGRWLVAGGVRSGKPGVWLVSPSDRQVMPISDVDLGTLAWAPDGRHIVGLYEPDVHVFPPKVQIMVLDVSGIVGS